MTEDDAVYRRNVRTMALVLAAIVLTVFAALFIPPLLNPVHEQFNQSGSVNSPYGFSLNIRLNATHPAQGAGVSVTAWLNSTSPQISNITAVNSWPIGPQGLWTRICTSGWPLGVGVMPGYYTSDNYTLGSLIRVPMPLLACPVSIFTPKYFLLQPYGSVAIVELNGALAHWNLTSTVSLGGPLLGAQRSSGVYTAVAADEWGDVVIAHFRISQ